MRLLRIQFHSLRQWLSSHRKQRLQQKVRWEYKVVQMVAQAPADASDASRKLGGSLSPEALRAQFPEHYGGVNGRKQINDFLNVLGDDSWELVGFQQIADLPLMVFKRQKQLSEAGSVAKPETGAASNHATTPS